MTDGVRGRALIININNFSHPELERKGSEEDYKNLHRLFKDLRFDIVKTRKDLTDLTASVGNSFFSESYSLEITILSEYIERRIKLK